MKLKVLIDNNTLIDRYFLGEPGLSFFIEDEDISILFDTGYSNAFISNAQKMNVNLLNIDFIVISHGHIDHTWGLIPLIRLYTEAKIEKIGCNNPILLAHPFAFLYKEFNDQEEIGCVISNEKLSKHFKMSLSKEPVWLTDRLIFLGEIERKNNFENKIPLGRFEINGIKSDDYLLDDSALVYKSSQGLVIITGCSHAGICNIIEYAKKVCHDERIADIIGGFHLLNSNEEKLKNTLTYFSQAKIKKVHACHCTDLKAKIELSRVVTVQEVGVGLVLEYEPEE